MTDAFDVEKIKGDLANLDAAIRWMEVFIKDVAGDNDRAAAITMIAIVDEELRRAIISRLLSLSNRMAIELFSESGPLGSLKAKIDLGFALGLYGEQTRADLHIARRVRNRFAHNFEISTFKEEKIVELCRHLKSQELIPDAQIKLVELESKFSPGRVRYLMALFLVFTNLTHLTKAESRITLMEGALP